MAQFAQTTPKDYKQTEIGVIPEDWDVVTMGFLGPFSKGQGIRKDQALSGNIPCIRYGEIYTHHNNIIKSYNSRISLDIAKTSKRLKKGDILFAGSGETKEEIGKCVAFLDDKEVYAGGDIVILSPSKGNSKFFGYLFNSPIVVLQKASKGQGDAIVHIGASALSKIKIPLPKTSEQNAIATILFDTDTLIEKLEKLIAKKKAIKQGTMQQLLTGKKRLEGFEKKKGYKQTEIGAIPEDWEVKKLGEIGDFKNGINKDSKYFGFGFPFANLLDIFGKTKIENNSYFGLINSNEREKKNYNLEKGDVLFIRSSVKPSGVGLTCVLMNDLPKTVFSGFLIRFRDKGYLNTSYKQYCFYNKRFRDDLISSSTISANTNINQEALKKIFIVFPNSNEEQTAIATVLSDMDKEIESLEKSLTKYRQIKIGMMQQLLTGKIRLIKK